MTSPQNSPLPYSGQRDQVFQNLGTRWKTDKYCSDQSGSCEYQFNTLGFRGDEFAPNAKFTVFIFGESDAFGLGVAYEVSWAVQVARAKAKSAGFTEQQTCIMNFAESGASNTYIARMLATQCRLVRPDLVLVHTAVSKRTELLVGEQSWNCGPWFGEPEMDASIEQADTITEQKREELRGVLKRGRGFLEHATHDQGLYQTLIELLLIQSVTALAGIETLMIGYDLHLFALYGVTGHTRLGPLAACLDTSNFRLCPLDQVFAEDCSGIDEHHLSTEAHQTIVDRILADEG